MLHIYYLISISRTFKHSSSNLSYSYMQQKNLDCKSGLKLEGDKVSNSKNTLILQDFRQNIYYNLNN